MSWTVVLIHDAGGITHVGFEDAYGQKRFLPAEMRPGFRGLFRGWNKKNCPLTDCPPQIQTFHFTAGEHTDMINQDDLMVWFVEEYGTVEKFLARVNRGGWNPPLITFNKVVRARFARFRLKCERRSS